MNTSTRRFIAGGYPVLLLVILAATPAIADTVTVHGAWIREAPPNAQVLAGYLVLENNSDAPRRLLGATSPAFASIEIHETVIEGGRAGMRRHAFVSLPANGRLPFAPGGYHLMLFKPRHPLRQGDKVAITLCFDNGGRLATTAIVKKPPDESR